MWGGALRPTRALVAAVHDVDAPPLPAVMSCVPPPVPQLLMYVMEAREDVEGASDQRQLEGLLGQNTAVKDKCIQVGPTGRRKAGSPPLPVCLCRSLPDLVRPCPGSRKITHPSQPRTA